MKGKLFLFALMLLSFLMTALGCTATHYLPHRPPTGNHGQGMAPPVDCPYQYKEIVTAPDGDHVFLYCWGKKTKT